MELSVSTKRAAQLLHVHESSIKRWCNAEVLACWHTPGGHRRIPLAALLRVAQAQSLPCLLLDLPSYEDQVWEGVTKAWTGQDYETLIDVFYGWLDEGDDGLPIVLFRFLLEMDFSLGDVFDHLVAPVLCRIGAGWQSHALAVGDEHRMTEIVRDSLYDVLIDLKKPGTRARSETPVAIVGCSRTEAHDLGALMVRLLLTAAGWRVVYLGKRVPTEDFAAQQARYGAALVCVSFASPQSMPDALPLVRMLAHLYDAAHPYRLALGGSGLQGGKDLPQTSTPFCELKCFEDTATFAAWLAALHPESPDSTT